MKEDNIAIGSMDFAGEAEKILNSAVTDLVSERNVSKKYNPNSICCCTCNKSNVTLRKLKTGKYICDICLALVNCVMEEKENA